MAHHLGQAAGSLLSGGVVDIVRFFRGSALTAYGVVFALEVLLVMGALAMLSQIKIARARVLIKSRAHQR